MEFLSQKGETKTEKSISLASLSAAAQSQTPAYFLTKGNQKIDLQNTV